jgi:hypothetical protein
MLAAIDQSNRARLNIHGDSEFWQRSRTNPCVGIHCQQEQPSEQLQRWANVCSNKQMLQ